MAAERRGGFTLLEVAIALGVLALMAAVLMPQVVGRLTTSQAATLGTNLSSLSTGITSYRGDMGRYPDLLSYLTTAPQTGAMDSCSRSLPDLTNWNGPYVEREIGTDGIRSGTSVIQNDVVRTPTTHSPTGTLTLTATEVDEAVAAELDAAFDAVVDFNSGTIRWVASGSSGTLTYVIPIRGC